MASLTAVNLYICANALLVLTATLLAGIKVASDRLSRPITYRHQLRLGQIVIAAAVLLPFASPDSSNEPFFPQTAQVWSAPTMEVTVANLTESHTAVSFAPSDASISLDALSRTAVILFLAGIIFLLARIAIDASATLRVIKGAHPIRRRGSLRILVSDDIQTPFSFWLPTRCFIVVPYSVVLQPADLRIAIRHEGQHHRQWDTRLLYAYQFLKALFFWNPAIHLLERHVRELQEFACDEALSSRRSISAHAYCRCLLRVAEAANQGQVSVRVWMAEGTGSVLKRRMEAILMRPSHHLNRSAVLIAAAAALTLIGATALAFTSTIQDRRISLEEAQRMAAIARLDSAFPIEVNTRVLRQLNLLLATPDGRALMQKGIRRMKTHEAAIAEKITRHNLPLELLAIPLVESGYRNLPPSDNPRQGAGLWMFIEPTARNFGLVVDENRDERLDVLAETEAAMRLLASLHAQFDDWGLALLSFNTGSANVARGIRETNSRDVWKIIAKGYENDADYVPRVIAAILIIKNPGVLAEHRLEF